MDWARKYIGMAWEDGARGPERFDCWGLVREVLAREYGIDVPSFAGAYASASELRWNDALIDGQRPQWSMIRSGEEQAGDIVVLRIGKYFHCGVIAEPGWMLHVMKGIDAVMESYRGMKWRRRIDGIYRYEPRSC